MRIATAVLLAVGLAGCAAQGTNCGQTTDGERWCQSCATGMVGVRCNNGKTEAFTYCASNDQYCKYLPLNAGGGAFTPVQ